MIEKTKLEKKKLMSIVIMIIIMLLTLILMVTTFTLEYRYGGHRGASAIIEEEKEVDALATLLMPEAVSLYVSNADLTKEKVGSLEYISIESEQQSAIVSLKSNADTTTCKYNVIYTTEYNYLENKYTLNNGSLGTLKSQLLLSVAGSQMNGTKQNGLSKEIDIIEIKNEDTIVLKDVLITDIQDDNSTDIEWKFKLTFRNYRDYNQINNGGKSVKGNITFEFVECERTK